MISDRLVLAFDVGTRNLGVCLLNDYVGKKASSVKEPPTLVVWKTFDLYEIEAKSKAEAAHRLALRLHAFLDTLDRLCSPFIPSLWNRLKLVGIESQAVSTAIMKRLECYLLSYFLLRCPHLSSGKVKVISASAKLKISGMKHEKIRSYNDRKQMAIKYMQHYMSLQMDVDDDPPKKLTRSDADRCDAALLALSMTKFSFAGAG